MAEKQGTETGGETEPFVTDTREGKDGKKGKKDPTKYMKRTTLIILLSILNVFLFAILIVIIAFYIKDKSQRVTINPSKTFCLPCDEVSIHPDDDPINFQYLTQREENGKKICCADHGQYLDKLMQLYVERKHGIKASMQNTRELEAACKSKVDDFMPQVMARVAGIQGTHNDGNYKVVDWKHSPTASTTQFSQNITFDQGTDEFVISKSGYYYVYAQVTMKINKMDQENASKSLCFNIYKTAAGTSEKLLENSRTRCKFQGNQSQSTSYIGAVFNLNKDDRIMVKVSDRNILEESEARSYFGLHII